MSDSDSLKRCVLTGEKEKSQVQMLGQFHRQNQSKTLIYFPKKTRTFIWRHEDAAGWWLVWIWLASRRPACASITRNAGSSKISVESRETPQAGSATCSRSWAGRSTLIRELGSTRTLEPRTRMYSSAAGLPSECVAELSENKHLVKEDTQDRKTSCCNDITIISCFLNPKS